MDNDKKISCIFGHIDSNDCVSSTIIFVGDFKSSFHEKEHFRRWRWWSREGFRSDYCMHACTKEDLSLVAAHILKKYRPYLTKDNIEELEHFIQCKYD